MVEPLALIVPAFIAGLVMFLAPCTLPLVPGYLGFISGVSAADLHSSAADAARAKKKIFLNGVFYVLGFSLVFIILGSLFGLGGASFVHYRIWLSRIGGVFVIFFGLSLLGLSRLPFFSILNSEHHFVPFRALKPGNPVSSFLFGATFAFGWTPCIGPILASVLLLASTTATVSQGAMLLAVFSLGLGIPFLIVAALIGSVAVPLQSFFPYLHYVAMISGIFLVIVGFLLVTNHFGYWFGSFYGALEFVHYNALQRFL